MRIWPPKKCDDVTGFREYVERVRIISWTGDSYHRQGEEESVKWNSVMRPILRGKNCCETAKPRRQLPFELHSPADFSRLQTKQRTNERAKGHKCGPGGWLTGGLTVLGNNSLRRGAAPRALLFLRYKYIACQYNPVRARAAKASPAQNSLISPS